MLSGEATNTNFHPWFDPIGAQTKIYHTRGEHANHYTTDAYNFSYHTEIILSTDGQRQRNNIVGLQIVLRL